MQTRRLASLLLAAAGASALTSSTAKAIFVFDVRAVAVTGAQNQVVNPKWVRVSPGGTITFELWGSIQTPYSSGNPEDGNPNNEANKVMIGSFLSSGSSVKGNLSATVVPAMQNLGFSNGTIQDLDGDGDLDVGSNISTSAADYWAARTTDTTNGLPGQASLLGTMTMTITSVPDSTTSTVVNFRKKTGASNSVGSWNENGTTVLSNFSNVTSGADVVLYSFVDPEPASTGLIALVGLTSLARRTSRRTQSAIR